MRCRLRVALLLWLGTATVLWGEAESPPEPASAGGFSSRPFFVQVRYVPSTLLRTDFSRADGSVASSRQDLTGTLIVPLPQMRGRVMLSGSHDWKEYRFRDNELLAGRLERARNIAFSGVYIGDLPGPWSLFAMSSVQTASERGAPLWNDRATGGSAQAQYQINEDLRVGVGFLAMDLWDEGIRVFPNVSFDWRATERLHIQTTRGLNVGYQLDERGHWTAGWNTEFFSSYIRLNDEGVGGGGVFRSRSVVSTLSLLYRPNPGMTLGAEVGSSIWRTLRIRDAERETVFKSRAEPGVTAAFSASLTF